MISCCLHTVVSMFEAEQAKVRGQGSVSVARLPRRPMCLAKGSLHRKLESLRVPFVSPHPSSGPQSHIIPVWGPASRVSSQGHPRTHFLKEAKECPPLQEPLYFSHKRVFFPGKLTEPACLKAPRISTRSGWLFIIPDMACLMNSWK